MYEFTKNISYVTINIRILQIDFMNDFSFGSTNSEEEVRNFIERYLMVYTNMITFSYLLNFDNAKTIGEV